MRIFVDPLVGVWDTNPIEHLDRSISGHPVRHSLVERNHF
jgi:hypothetical protein